MFISPLIQMAVFSKNLIFICKGEVRLNNFWTDILEPGYYDKILINGLEKKEEFKQTGII